MHTRTLVRSTDHATNNVPLSKQGHLALVHCTLTSLLAMGCSVVGIDPEAAPEQTGIAESALALEGGSSATLLWPKELPAPLVPGATLYETPKANYMLDLHGDPGKSDLVVFMAGNQYMVLPDLVSAFKEWYPTYATANGLTKKQVGEIFYATTPPGILIRAMDSGQLVIGNLTLSVNTRELWPDVFMTGARQQKMLYQKGYTANYYTYTQNRGVGLLVRDGNPAGISSVLDLARDDVRVAMSSPTREPASYESYGRVLNAQSAAGWNQSTPLATYVINKPTTISPFYVHHRENPQFLADGLADVAPMYRHFGIYLEQTFPNTFDFIALPDEGNEFASMGVAEIATARHPEAGHAWTDFLRTDIARGIYEAHGFSYATDEVLGTPVVPL